MTDDRAFPASLEGNLGFNAHRVGLLFRRELMRALKRYGLTPEQWQIMRALADETQPMDQGRVGWLTCKDKHSVSRMAARLEQKGWIERSPREGDARVVELCITDAGRRVAEDASKRLSAHFDEIWRVLSARERASLEAGLKKLRQAMEA